MLFLLCQVRNPSGSWDGWANRGSFGEAEAVAVLSWLMCGWGWGWFLSQGCSGCQRGKEELLQAVRLIWK